MGVRMGARKPPVWQLACVTLTLLMLLVGFHKFGPESRRLFSKLRDGGDDDSPDAPFMAKTTTKPLNPDFTTAPQFVKSIMDPLDSAFERIACPNLDIDRYDYLRAAPREQQVHGIMNVEKRKVKIPLGNDDKLKYFFALDLRQAAPILPRLLGSIVEAIRFLGPRACSLSIVEGNSDDGTWEILSKLAPKLKDAGVRYHLVSSALDPDKGNRVLRLARLRNLALAPLVQADSSTVHPDAAVVFLNDVVACPEDILELIHQKRALGADMTCGLDWVYSNVSTKANPTFADYFGARTLKGETFFDIPSDGSLEKAWDLFWNDGGSKERFSAHRPFQVYSCWNGGAVFSARAVMGSKALRFRGFKKGECARSEGMLFSEDLWWRSMGHIAVIPSVNLAYSDETARNVKAAKGYVAQWAEKEDAATNKLQWRDYPPDKVRCWTTYDKQEWRPWDAPLHDDGEAR